MRAPGDKQYPWLVSRWRFVVIATGCLSIGAGVLSAVFLPTLRATFVDNDALADENVGYWSFGWPLCYGTSTTSGPLTLLGAASGLPPPPFLPSQLETGGLYYLVVDLFVGFILMASPIVAGRARLAGQLAQGQYALSDVFSLTTAVAILFSLFAVERTYGWAETAASAANVYSALSTRPLFEQTTVSLGIICTLYVLIAALCQALRLTATKGRGLRKIGL